MTCISAVPYKDKVKQKAYQHEWQKNNRKPRSQQGGIKTKRDLIVQMKERPCESCGGLFHHRAMHFHHRDPQTKVESVSRLERTASVATILAEINKCVLLCANCHAEIHAGVRPLPECHERESNPQDLTVDAF